MEYIEYMGFDYLNDIELSTILSVTNDQDFNNEEVLAGKMLRWSLNVLSHQNYKVILLCDFRFLELLQMYKLKVIFQVFTDGPVVPGSGNSILPGVY